MLGVVLINGQTTYSAAEHAEGDPIESALLRHLAKEMKLQGKP
ncbi:hypothetical protein GME_04907 [Halomonas sp. TD01]|nr:hypothetical protein GME_04907 [Halomonas sp. TD01]